jgi:hypothetical protein
VIEPTRCGLSKSNRDATMNRSKKSLSLVFVRPSSTVAWRFSATTVYRDYSRDRLS